MVLTLDQLRQFLPRNKYVEHWHSALSQLLPDYDIDTPRRIASFLAQCSHESAGFTALKENLNYKPTTLLKLFGKYFTPELAAVYCAKPNRQEAIANRIYASRMGNGDEASGDGFKFSGKGLIQLTGKDNYTRFAQSLEITTEDAADYMQTFQGACQSACFFWETTNLNMYAEAMDFETMTKRINGGVIGLEDRKKHYAEALHILGA
jgi:putative chitinase